MAPQGIKHTLQLPAVTILALTCMFYPFMPGTYDRLAVSLSAMAQALGVTGLLMVPIGILWLIHELARRRARTQGSAPRRERRSWFALSATAASVVVMAGVALAAAIESGPALAVAVLMLWVFIIRRALAAVRRMRMADDSRVNAAPFYLILVPCILVAARLMYFPAAVEFSRHRTITGSAQFISAIEGYRAAHGSYPVSLGSVHHDYHPPTIGVERYYYEPDGQTYNVFFEQPTFPIGMREFVMYNPVDQHVMIVHNQDILESPPEQVARERGFHARAARDAGVAHWKYFWFD
jgi:hypothetical protein